MAQVVKLPELKAHYTVEETALVLNETIEGKPMASALFREAMVRSDMPLAFNQISNAEMVPQYKAYEPKWQEFSKRITLKDLTEQSYIELWPSLATLPPRENGRLRVKNKAPRIGANNEYPAIALDESTAKVKAEKYGLRMPITIEMIINDQLDALADYPEALAIYMRTLEDIITAEQLVSADGQTIAPGITRLAASADFATPVNAPLSIEAVAAGLQQLANVEVHGVRTGLVGVRLVVPRALELKAQQIVTTTRREITTTTSGGSVKVEEGNPAAGLGVTVLDPLGWVNIGPASATTWYLIASQQSQVGRPSLVTGFLRQYPNPQTFISSPNALTPAGGLAPWTDGSFLNDSIEFKVRHFAGSKIVFAEGIIASAGTGQASV